MAGSPEKIKFLKDGMNIIDVLAIMPFFVSLFFLGPKVESADLVGPGVIETEEESGVEDILQVFRIFKLARVLKLARHSPGLQVIFIACVLISVVNRYTGCPKKKGDSWYNRP